jgi:AcrR family transcriptional regulator
MRDSATPTRKNTGRPARLNREQILDAALALLRDSGGQDLSIRQLAQRLETVPGNLYTYFPNKAALLDALAEYTLGSLDISLDHSLPWDGQIAQWLHALRNTLKQRPELMLLMGLAGTSPSTLATIGRLARLIQDAGLDKANAVLHAQGLLWMVMSYTLFELQASNPAVVKQLQQTSAHKKNSEVLQHLAVEDLEPLWLATLARNLDGLRFQVLHQK